jgi:hypothetical protein
MMTPRSPCSSAFGLAHRVGGQAAHVEGADQVDVDRALEHVQRVRAVLADGLDGRRHAGAVDQAAQRAHGHGGGDHGLAVGLRGHVALDEARPPSSAASAGRLRLHVGQHDLAAASTIMRAVAAPRPDAPPVMMNTLF